MQLSEHFTLEELTTTDTGLSNAPNEEEVEKLKWLAGNLLEPIRSALGPIVVNSAFRSEEVNKAVGGVPNSQHRLAEAADIKPVLKTLEEAYSWIKDNVKFGQLIIEHSKGARWIHISREREGKQNQQCLRFEDGKYTNA